MMKNRISCALLMFALGLPARAFALQILSPLEGAIVRPGELVTIRVGPGPGESITSVRIASGAGGLEASPVPGEDNIFEGQIRVPIEAVGPELIVAAASLADGRLVSTHVQVEADPGPATRLVILPPPVLTTTGQVVRLEVVGTFADGVARDLTAPETGTRYETSNATVLGIDPSGLVQARASGTAGVRVLSRGLAATATVAVAVPMPPVNAIPIADPGLDLVVAPLAIVTLSGAASRDPDGDPLVYSWEQLAGPLISLRSAAAATASFLSPAVTQETVMEFSLTVRDNRGAASLPERVRVIVRP